MNDILFEDRPAYFDLSVGAEGKSLIVATHTNVTQVLNKAFARSALMIESPQNNFEFQFLPITDKWPWWGLGPVFDRLPPRRPNWDHWECPLPAVMVYPESMKRKPADFEPPSIHDQWPEPNIYWQHAFGISATLGTIFRTAEYLEDSTDATFPQLMDLNLITQVGLHGAELSVSLGTSMLPWLSHQIDNSQNKEAEKVMLRAYEHMSGKETEPFSRYNVLLRDYQWINLSCPGDASGLDPENYNRFSDDRGYRLNSHNVDSPMQQLTLIMGLASIHDQVRRSQFGN